MKKQMPQFAAILIFSIVCFNSCVSELQSSKTLDTGASGFEFTPNFSVEYLGNNVKLVTDAINRKLLLVPRGQDAPAGYEDAMVVKTPVERALFLATTQVGMVRPLGIWGSITGIVSRPGTSGSMDKDVKESGFGIEYISGIEQIISLNPDIMFIFTEHGPDLTARLEASGVPYAVNNEWREKKHTDRMSWIKFLAAFFDKDEEAIKHLDSQMKKLKEMETLLAGAEKPKVAWGMISNGAAYVPGNDSYEADQLRAAGCEYVFSHITGINGVISVKEFYNTLNEADIWIYSSISNNVTDYASLIELASSFADVPSVVNKRVWLRHEDYFYFTDQSAEQVVELAAIFHPDLYPDFKHFHYSALESE